jgi:hydroxyacyl-ACP dehydratase HTD2-like protein with hotdog domain
MIGAFIAIALLVWAGASRANENRIHVKIVFFDFYNEQATLWVDNRFLWSGPLTVSKERETTGQSLLIEADLPKCSSTIAIRAKSFADKKRLCLTDKTKLIYLSAIVKPHISSSESSVIKLD